MRSFIKNALMILALLSLPMMASYAKMGCCARHGGVAGCNNATGYQKCNDGTTSPSCLCESVTVAPKTKATAKKALPDTLTTPAKKTMKAPATPTKPAKAAKTPAAPVKTTGCCSRHGGVGKCNKSTGYFMCKDKTQSPVCKCS
jgi:hypothetical protein